MTPTPRYVTDVSTQGPDFTVCTLLRDPEKYDRLLASFARAGFDASNSEFLAADNRGTNRFDGYDWQKAVLAEARGQFVIFCHDDIELLEAGAAGIEPASPAWKASAYNTKYPIIAMV